MVRECLFGLTSIALAALGGCSLVLDFSDENIPKDAYDLPYTPEQCTYYEPNDSVAAAPAIVDGMTNAAICLGDVEDHDFYKFTVPMGATSVVVNLTFAESATGDLDLKLYDATGSLLAQSRQVTASETITCPSMESGCATLAPGDYVFEVYPALMVNKNAYDFSVTVTAP
jgi:hypothetical protein